ncbi:uncharacterized protein LOC142819007 [Pelodiscus sinensis]|uniref:uncharacterized protein LOC142819007 n=1 Tax=Pelodiscus sinensis TaxID=13735 RepID=UPI003F6BAED3
MLATSAKPQEPIAPLPAQPAGPPGPGRAAVPAGGRKVWLAVATAELAVVLILAAGLGHLVAAERGLAARWRECERGAHGDRLVLRGEMASANRTLQETRQAWDECKDHAQGLQKNITNLAQVVTRLKGNITQQEVEKDKLRDEISTWKNTVQHLQEQKDQYRREVSWLQEQLQRHQSLRSSVGSTKLPGLLTLLAASLAGLLVGREPGLGAEATPRTESPRWEMRNGSWGRPSRLPPALC